MSFGNFFPFHYFCFSSNKKGAGTPPSPVLSISIPLIPENFRPIPICFFVSHFKWLVTCALDLTRQNAQKELDKAEKKKQRERKAKLKSRSEWIKEAQSVFNKFIRLRDKDQPCISCGRYHQGKYDAGHYRSVGACPELRFCEINCFRQCVPCNQHKSGNIIEYRINLVKRIGADKVAWLERQDHEPKKYTIEDCKAIIKYYKTKIKELEE